MNNQFKTFRCLKTGLFASIHDGTIYTSEKPQCIFCTTATVEAAKHFFPEVLLKQVELVTIEYTVKSE